MSIIDWLTPDFGTEHRIFFLFLWRWEFADPSRVRSRMDLKRGQRHPYSAHHPTHRRGTHGHAPSYRPSHPLATLAAARPAAAARLRLGRLVWVRGRGCGGLGGWLSSIHSLLPKISAPIAELPKGQDWVFSESAGGSIAHPFGVSDHPLGVWA